MIRIALPLVLAAVGFALAGLPAGAQANQCASYEVHHDFKFEGSKKAGCIGVSRADLAAGSGTLYYYDNYCGGMKVSASFERDGDTLKLRDATYPYCKGGAGSADTARISIVGMTETCFTRLDFRWLGNKKTYDFVALPTSCN